MIDASSVGTMMDFGTRAEWDGAKCVLYVQGEIDVAVAPQLKKALLEVNHADPLVIEMCDVTFLDSTGISLLVNARKENPTMQIIAPEGGRIVRLMEIVGLMEFLQVTSPE